MLKLWHVFVFVIFPAVGDVVCPHLRVLVTVLVVDGIVRNSTAMRSYTDVFACGTHKWVAVQRCPNCAGDLHSNVSVAKQLFHFTSLPARSFVGDMRLSSDG